MRQSLVLALAWVLAGVFYFGCATSRSQAVRSPAGFDDHAIGKIGTVSELLSFAGNGASTEQVFQVKFAVLGFSSPSQDIRFFSPTFYGLHDEWYWFRLANGQPIPGLSVQPLSGRQFHTVAEAAKALRAMNPAPYGLEMSADRLVSREFYSQAEGDRRYFGLGSLIHFPANPNRGKPDEIWAFDLVFSDKLDQPELERFFSILSQNLPQEIGSKLMWFPRSAAQEQLANQLLSSPQFKKRVIRTADLAVAGAKEIYTRGMTVGRVKLFRKGTFSDSAVGPNDIVVLEELPDELPVVAGVVTAIPQTALSHVALLSKGRGTVNVYIDRALGDESIRYYAEQKTPVILYANQYDIEWVPITEQDYATYLRRVEEEKKQAQGFSLPQVDLAGAPLSVDLSGIRPAQIPKLGPLAGGKCVGMAILLGSLKNAKQKLPYRPLGITVRAYAEHVAPLRELIGAVLADPAFQGSKAARMLLLEGPKRFAERNAQNPAALKWQKEFTADLDPASAPEKVLQAGGVQGLIRKTPIASRTLEELLTKLRAQFGELAPEQGLRFRSSATVEDIPGFSAAGLYESFSGYLESQPGSAKQKTVEEALKKTWASYWSLAAFEERSSVGIDHFAGNMGVLVEPNFPDELEAVNGVITIRRQQREQLTSPQLGDYFRYEMIVNTQVGAASVTNPDPSHPVLPEVDRVELSSHGMDVIIHREKSSSLVPAGTKLLTDDELKTVFQDVIRLINQWYRLENSGVPVVRLPHGLTLDLEFKKVKEGWPRMRSGEVLPARIVLKQSRVMAEGSSRPKELYELPIPRDILENAEDIHQRTCSGPALEFETLEVYTGEALPGYREEPFNGQVKLLFKKPVQGFPLALNQKLELFHPDLNSLEHPFMHHGFQYWDLALELKPKVAKRAGFDSFQIFNTGSWKISSKGGARTDGSGSPCEWKSIWSKATTFLDHLYKEYKKNSGGTDFIGRENGGGIHL